MPGLFGIIAKKQGLGEHRLLSMAQRMSDVMRRVPWLRAEIWGNDTFCGGRVHLGVLNPSPQPLVTTDQSIRVWLDGEFYPTSTATGTISTAQEVSELVSGAAAGLAETDGVFALACFNGGKQELILANDRLGFRPLYYTETPDWFAYAGEVKALLAILDKLPDLDEVSLRQFFGFDHMLGERTWWKGIELIPPASVWRISAKGPTQHQYWTFSDVRRDPRDKGDVEVEFSRLWSEDVRRHSKPGTMPLLLSAGQDSRLLLAELRAQGADLVAITFGSEESPEMKPARRIAAIAGIPHRRCYLNTHNWWHHREEAIWQTDGLVNGINLHAAVATDEVHIGNWYCPQNIAGDLLFGGSHLDRKCLPDWRLSPDKLLAPRYVENPFFDQDEVLSVSIPDAQRCMHGPSSDCFHLRQRMRRLTLTGPGCLAPYCETVFPGVSHPFLQLMLGYLSDEQRIGHKFYNSWLGSRYPAYYASVPWQATGRGLAESGPTRLYRDVRTRVRLLVEKLANDYPNHLGHLSEWTKPIPSDQWFVNYPECIRESKIRDKLLREDLLADQFLDGRAKRLLADGDGRPISPQALLAILTFETYLRQVAGMSNLTVLLSHFPKHPIAESAL